MNTKFLMAASAVFMAGAGVTLSFLPEETAVFLNFKPVPEGILLLQLTGALYFGFGMLNWMAKGVLIGGIYNRPLAIGNFSHFLTGSLALGKVISGLNSEPAWWVIICIYVFFALAFGITAFTHPLKTKQIG